MQLIKANIQSKPVNSPNFKAFGVFKVKNAAALAPILEEAILKTKEMKKDGYVIVAGKEKLLVLTGKHLMEVNSRETWQKTNMHIQENAIYYIGKRFDGTLEDKVLTQTIEMSSQRNNLEKENLIYRIAKKFDGSFRDAIFLEKLLNKFTAYNPITQKGGIIKTIMRKLNTSDNSLSFNFSEFQAVVQKTISDFK